MNKVSALAENEQKPWGRVDETGAVYVRDAEGAERLVGEYPDGTPEEALAYFERKYAELAGQVTLLEQRAKGGAAANDVAKTVERLLPTIADASAVGDLASLTSRLEALRGTVGELTEQQSAAQKEAVQAAIVERTAIVESAEALAVQDPARVQWKQTSAKLDELFALWQRHQQDGPRLPKGEANELWKRFRTARSTVEQHRRAFFAELDGAHKEARTRKQALVARAQELTSRGADGIPAYRQLLDDWKAAGRAGKKVDDQLWAQFKEAGDVLYAAKNEELAVENEEFSANLELKEALLVEATPLLQEQDPKKAKNALLAVQRKWDAIGKVPRDKVRSVEDRIRAIESHVKGLEEEHWKRSNPERKARSEGFAGQLHDAIARLERELEDAQSRGDQRKIREAEAALATQRSWLGAIRD